MRKTLLKTAYCLLATACCLLLAVSCNKDDEQPPETDDPTEQPEEPSGPISIQLLLPDNGATINLNTVTPAQLTFRWTVRPTDTELMALLGQAPDLSDNMPIIMPVGTTSIADLPLPPGIDIIDLIDTYLKTAGERPGQTVNLYWTVIPADSNLATFSAEIRLVHVILKQ
jgi:hypothetical protein